MSPILSNLTERDCLALTIYGEARNQPLDGQVAVGCVILNRLRTGRWKTLREVVFARAQFSCWSQRLSGPENFADLMVAADRALTGYIAMDLALQQAYWVADGLLAGYLRNPIGSARHYLNPKSIEGPLPAWAEPAKRTKIIGSHHFYAGVA
jgi:N-acetylmuramoyl-L-alanine amidase